MTRPCCRGRLYVVVGVLTDAKNAVLIQQRRAATPKAGMWEFPGGKVEPGETPADALIRELSEELGIAVTKYQPLTVVTYDYEHARVLLDTFLVTDFNGHVTAVEGQQIAWTTLERINEFDILPAVVPIVDAIISRRANQQRQP